MAIGVVFQSKLWEGRLVNNFWGVKWYMKWNDGQIICACWWFATFDKSLFNACSTDFIVNVSCSLASTEFFSRSKPHSSLMSLPPHLLCRLSFMYNAFSKLYLSQLLCWADKMAPSICASETDCHTVRGVQWRYVSVVNWGHEGYLWLVVNYNAIQPRPIFDLWTLHWKMLLCLLDKVAATGKSHDAHFSIFSWPSFNKQMGEESKWRVSEHYLIVQQTTVLIVYTYMAFQPI